jgi:penicillin-binding protein 1C
VRRQLAIAGVAAALAAALVLPPAALELAARLAPAPSRERLGQLSPMVSDAAGGLLRAFLSPDQRWRLRARAADLPAEFIPLLVAWEDKRFFSHRGVDWWALARALGQLAAAQRVVSGGSTLSMQVARLLEPRPRGLGSKLRQLVAARRLEIAYSKSAILDMYLTLAPFGGNLEGVRAASLAYFGKEPKALSVGEQALLVALPQSPERRRPDLHPGLARIARDRVLARAADTGRIAARTAATGLRERVRVSRRPLMFGAAHLAELLVRRDGAKSSVRSLVDGVLQTGVERLIAQHDAVRRGEISAAVVVVRNGDMAVRAWASGTGFLTDPRAGQLDLARVVRSPGSALKPVVYGLAFERLLVHPLTVITDEPVRFSAYEPRNFSEDYHGDMTVRDALIRSVNTAAVSVLASVGPEAMTTRLRQAGLELRLDDTDMQAGLSIALGGCGTTLADLARLYAGIANGGLVRPLRLTPSDPPGIRRRLLSADAAWAISDILADAPPPEGFITRTAVDGGRRLAYKTGTSFSFRDAWAVGFDGLHTVAVWLGRPDGTPALGNIGRQTAAPLLFAVMDLLPVPESDVAGPPRPGNPLASTRSIPPRLQRFAAASADQARTGPPLKIAFPHDGSRVLAQREPAGGEPAGLPLVAQGGRLPLFWYVDGRQIAAAGAGQEVRWRPDGPGQVRVKVLDASGQSATVEFWVE